MKPISVVRAAHLPKRPDDLGSLPVLTDVLVPARSRSGRMLWLAWDERRVPLLDDVVDDGELVGPPIEARRLRGHRGTR
jgi:hypothetical protein